MGFGSQEHQNLWGPTLLKHVETWVKTWRQEASYFAYFACSIYMILHGSTHLVGW